VRFTFVGAFLAFFTWFVCTAGSDQVAIQRYMATRDAKTARRMFHSSLFANVLLWPFLACVGVALMTYFRVNPHMLPAGQSVTSAADELLPIFIVKGLPAGVSGLVIAGLMAAAMSSLSSGLNSGCSVVVADFIDRFRADGSSAAKSGVNVSRLVSFSIGVIVVLLGAVVGQVEGNLLQLCYKVANLLTAPLFTLFFMALFVPWSTSFGTYVAAAVAVVVAVAIGYFEVFGIGFVWLLPASFVFGVGAGCLFSIPNIGQRVIRPDR
jgi:Na+/proline symporter